MKWTHLPVAGGLYDQHPELLDRFRYIFAKRAQHDAEESKKREAEQKRKAAQSARGSRAPSRGRRR